MQSNNRAASTLPVSVAPEFQHLAPPVLIVGMHRSGTSLVAGMLHILGVYIDPALPLPQDQNFLEFPGERTRQNGYGEATCFRLLNEEIMAQAGADWLHIAPFMEQRDTPDFKRQSLDRMRRAAFRTLKQEFFAPLPAGYAGAWGWKDPRNSLTLPYWLELFPEARILHVRRNAEDITKSLMRRAQAEAREVASAPPLSPLQRLLAALRQPHLALRALGRRLGLVSPTPSSTRSPLEKADYLALTEEYVEACLQFRPYEHYLELWYEDIIQEPEAYARLLADFLSLQPSESQLQHAGQFVKPRPELKQQAAPETPEEVSPVTPRR